MMLASLRYLLAGYPHVMTTFSTRGRSGGEPAGGLQSFAKISEFARSSRRVRIFVAEDA